MNNLNIKYHNVDTVQPSKLLRKDNDIVNNIQDTILNMPALNIVNNDKLLENTMIEVLIFLDQPDPGPEVLQHVSMSKSDDHPPCIHV